MDAPTSSLNHSRTTSRNSLLIHTDVESCKRHLNVFLLTKQGTCWRRCTRTSLGSLMIPLEVCHCRRYAPIGLMTDYVVQSMITSTSPEDRSRVIGSFTGHLQNSMSCLSRVIRLQADEQWLDTSSLRTSSKKPSNMAIENNERK